MGLRQFVVLVDDDGWTDTTEDEFVRDILRLVDGFTPACGVQLPLPLNVEVPGPVRKVGRR